MHLGLGNCQFAQGTAVDSRASGSLVKEAEAHKDQLGFLMCFCLLSLAVPAQVSLASVREPYYHSSCVEFKPEAVVVTEFT